MTPADEATVEAVAKALREQSSDQHEFTWHAWINDARAAIAALDLPGIIRAAKVDAINDAVMLLDGNDPGWPRDPYSPMSCLEDHMAELTIAALERGAGE